MSRECEESRLRNAINRIIVVVMNETERKKLIDAMVLHAERMGIAPSTLGARAGNGGDFFNRLTSGARIWPETGQKVWDFIAANSTSLEGSE